MTVLVIPDLFSTIRVVLVTLLLFPEGVTVTPISVHVGAVELDVWLFSRELGSGHDACCRSATDPLGWRCSFSPLWRRRSRRGSDNEFVLQRLSLFCGKQTYCNSHRAPQKMNDGRARAVFRRLLSTFRDIWRGAVTTYSTLIALHCTTRYVGRI